MMNRNSGWPWLLAELAGEHHLTVQEWNSCSPKAGWSLRLEIKKPKDTEIAKQLAAIKLAH